MDPLEIGKYAEWRSKDKYGDHVTEEHDHAEVFPGSSQLGNLTHSVRNDIY